MSIPAAFVRTGLALAMSGLSSHSRSTSLSPHHFEVLRSSGFSTRLFFTDVPVPQQFNTFATFRNSNATFRNSEKYLNTSFSGPESIHFRRHRLHPKQKRPDAAWVQHADQKNKPVPVFALLRQESPAFLCRIMVCPVPPSCLCTSRRQFVVRMEHEACVTPP